MRECFDQAALRHYEDAQLLAKNQRLDNAGHLIGFAAECAIKSILQISLCQEIPRKHLPCLAQIAVKKIKGRNPRASPLLDVLKRFEG